MLEKTYFDNFTGSPPAPNNLEGVSVYCGVLWSIVVTLGLKTGDENTEEQKLSREVTRSCENRPKAKDWEAAIGHICPNAPLLSAEQVWPHDGLCIEDKWVLH